MNKWKFLNLPGLKLQPLCRPARKVAISTVLPRLTTETYGGVKIKLHVLDLSVRWLVISFMPLPLHRWRDSLWYTLHRMSWPQSQSGHYGKGTISPPSWIKPWLSSLYLIIIQALVLSDLMILYVCILVLSDIGLYILYTVSNKKVTSVWLT
jgi:hypothetical protein